MSLTISEPQLQNQECHNSPWCGPRVMVGGEEVVATGGQGQGQATLTTAPAQANQVAKQLTADLAQLI